MPESLQAKTSLSHADKRSKEYFLCIYWMMNSLCPRHFFVQLFFLKFVGRLDFVTGHWIPAINSSLEIWWVVSMVTARVNSSSSYLCRTNIVISKATTEWKWNVFTIRPKNEIFFLLLGSTVKKRERLSSKAVCAMALTSGGLKTTDSVARMPSAALRRPYTAQPSIPASMVTSCACVST